MKKVLSLVLVAVLAIGMSVSAFAAPAELTTAHKVADFGTNTLADFYGKASDDLGIINPIQEYKVKIDLTRGSDTLGISSLFKIVEADGTTVVNSAENGDWMSKRVLDRGKVGVRVSYGKGKEAVKSVSITSKGILEIAFVTEYVSTGSIDFEFTVYLTINGKGDREDGITFYGTLENELQDYYDENTDYIYMADKIVVKTVDNLRDVILDLGSGVEMQGVRLTEGRKYYGTADTKTSSADDELFDEYGFLEVYNLHTVNLSYTGNYVRLTNASSKDYIYGYDNGELVFAGMGDEKLPYFSKYYVSVKELDLGAGEEPEEPSEPADGQDTPDLGGDDATVPSDNTNFNPGTGA